MFLLPNIETFLNRVNVLIRVLLETFKSSPSEQPKDFEGFLGVEFWTNLLWVSKMVFLWYSISSSKHHTVHIHIRSRSSKRFLKRTLKESLENFGNLSEEPLNVFVFVETNSESLPLFTFKEAKSTKHPKNHWKTFFYKGSSNVPQGFFGWMHVLIHIKT